MSVFESNAVTLEGDFGPASRAHNVLQFAEEALRTYDSRDHSSWDEWTTDDYSVVAPTGERLKGRAGFDTANRLFDKVLTAHYHVPTTVVVVDTKDGHKMIASGTMYGNLLAVSALNPTKISAPDGSKWDLAIPLFGEMDLVKDANAKHYGLRFSGGRFTLDQNEALKGVESRGISVPGFLKK